MIGMRKRKDSQRKAIRIQSLKLLRGAKGIAVTEMRIIEMRVSKRIRRPAGANRKTDYTDRLSARIQYNQTILKS